MPSPLGEEVHVPTSNGPKRIVNLSCLFLLPPIKMGESNKTLKAMMGQLNPNSLNKQLEQCLPKNEA
jgi:hypothetical protein